MLPMKYFYMFPLLMLHISAFAKNKTTEIHHPIPDSVNAVSYLATVNIQSIFSQKEISGGIKEGAISLALVAEKKEKNIVFAFPKNAQIVARGIDVISEKGELAWSHPWQTGEDWKLMISIASDSAENFTLYSAYVLIPKVDNWKLIGTCRTTGWKQRIKDPIDFFSSGKKELIQADISSQWVQLNNGSWKNVQGQSAAIPVINLISNADSAQQFAIETKAIQEAIAAGNTDANIAHDGIYYTIMREGNGQNISVNDTV